MSRKENIVYYKIMSYKLLLFSILVPGTLADHDQDCQQDLALFYVFISLLAILMVVHAVSHVHWSKKVIATLERTPEDVSMRVMKSLHS